MADNDESTEKVDPEIRRLRSENQNLRERLRNTETERDAARGEIATAVEAARAEVRTEATRQVAEARLVAAAAARLADPADVTRFVDLASIGDGSDTAALTKAIDGLLEAKPYLAKPAAAPPPPEGGTPPPPTPLPSADQGNTGTPPPAAQPNFNEVLKGLSGRTTVTFQGDAGKG